MNRHNAPKWRRHSKVRTRRELKARKAFAVSCGAPRAISTLKIGGGRSELENDKKRITLVAPKVFSLVHNYEETLLFLHNIRKMASARTFVFLDLSNVVELSIDSVLVLCATIKSAPKSRNGFALIKGNSPRDKKSLQLLIDSGFFSMVAAKFPIQRSSHMMAEIHQRVGKKVDPDKAASLSAMANKCLYGNTPKMQGVYRVIIEAMGNTKQHAKPDDESSQRWWVMALCDPIEKTAKFAFYDSGVGILGSLRTRLAYWFAAVGLDRPDSDVLHDLMHGSNESRTGFPFRGKGLPSMAMAVSRGQISRLYVMSNSARADVAADDYGNLPLPFNGTLLYWEIEL